jgi:hypothetical protein
MDERDNNKERKPRWRKMTFEDVEADLKRIEAQSKEDVPEKQATDEERLEQMSAEGAKWIQDSIIRTIGVLPAFQLGTPYADLLFLHVPRTSGQRIQH